LQNDKATPTTSLKDFLEGSIMTFYYKGTLIIWQTAYNNGFCASGADGI